MDFLHSETLSWTGGVIKSRSFIKKNPRAGNPRVPSLRLVWAAGETLTQEHKTNKVSLRCVATQVSF